ncbi:hypothetical protein UXN85_20770 [Enterobacter hormaechei]
MKILSKILAWMLKYIPRRTRNEPEKKTEAAQATEKRLGAPSAFPKATPRIPAMQRVHRAGAPVDPSWFAHAPMPEPELPHSDPRSPFHKYWLQDSPTAQDVIAITTASVAAATLYDQFSEQQQPEPAAIYDAPSQPDPVSYGDTCGDFGADTGSFNNSGADVGGYDCGYSPD